ncbi:Clavaminate synthase-like protein [Punctularia strigosozonata HHB-11173 SS5]|uniref:Clavaminate synthase-like protein n=1 Tax=Punctularia strigosozonata (strain HHB-11173) TaxID=741275 RepID=UPI0004416EA5|nr:Clavaminate synthase-like protein [Punctularia strigosozonata HHB-11173 SS5]EIN10622.1 Clavaminate synthase-like protein [Punctularia strigosozonata HHB-11173 SS5]
MGGRDISVAVTPNGHADAVTCGQDGITYFAEPHVQKTTMSSLLSTLSAPETCDEVQYLQSQNGNIYSAAFFENEGQDQKDDSEFAVLRPDVPSEIPWCSETFGKHPDAVNVWIGNEKSVTSIHSDPYENIYTVVRGAKHFLLLSPTDGWCLEERKYPHATYMKHSDGSLRLSPSASNYPQIRWSSVTNPHIPGILPSSVHPFHITLEAGDSLYLPAGWWHHVRQSNLTIALNWWYDLEYRGMQWILLSFLRGTEDVPDGNDRQGISDGKTRTLQAPCT